MNGGMQLGPATELVYGRGLPPGPGQMWERERLKPDGLCTTLYAHDPAGGPEGDGQGKGGLSPDAFIEAINADAT